MLVSGFLDYFIQSYGGYTCVKQGADSYTYRQLDGHIDRLANAMARHGIEPGNRVAVLCNNSVQQIALFYACMRIGAVYVPLNFRLAADELGFIINDSESTLVFAGGDELSAKIDGITDLQVSGKILFDTAEKNGWISLAAFLAIDGPQRATGHVPQPQDTVYQMYTSGTTGLPKGVMISHRQLSSFITAYNIMPPHIREHKPHLVVAPLFHAAAFSLVLAALSCGRPVVVMESFNPVRVAEIIGEQRVADLLLVPAMMQALVNSLDNMPDVDLSSLECIIYGGSPISESLLRRAVEVFDCDFIQGFGMTEMVTGVIWLTPEDHRRGLNGEEHLLRSCGKPCAFNQMKVVDPHTGDDLKPGETGEILIRGGQMMQGYWKQPEKTAEAIREGWYHSGDAGCLDEEGYLYIKDRIKDMVVSGGENIYPAEIENVLSAHPAIREVAVVGVPDDKYGEALLAVCVSETGNPVDGEDIIEFCRLKIAGYKIPRRYEFIDQIPRNAAGKILKRELRIRFSPR